jgi:hypothetical protein
MTVSKLAILMEQTKFLLQQQLEMKKFYQQGYADFLSLIEGNLQQAEREKSQQAVDDLLFIQQIIKEQSSLLVDEIDEDVDFLEEQVAAIRHIEALDDVEKKKEYEHIILNDNPHLLESDLFKEEVTQEAHSARQTFAAMIEDFKSTLEEGGGHGLALLLEAIIKEDEEQLRAEEEEEDDEDEDEDELLDDEDDESWGLEDDEESEDGEDDENDECCPPRGATRLSNDKQRPDQKKKTSCCSGDSMKKGCDCSGKCRGKCSDE